MIKRILNKLSLWLHGDETLISDEGYEILADPVKRVKLRKWVENYHKTGVWDYSFWDEPNKQVQSDSGWFDVNEKLPTNDNQLIICIGKQGRFMAMYMGYYGNGKWCIECEAGWIDDYDNNSNFSYVTHWMETPDAPCEPGTNLLLKKI